MVDEDLQPGSSKHSDYFAFFVITNLLLKHILNLSVADDFHGENKDFFIVLLRRGFKGYNS